MKIKGIPVGTTMPRPDWNQLNPNRADYIKNKPTIESLEATDDGNGIVTLAYPSGGGDGFATAVSPTIEVAEIDGGHEVTVTDVNCRKSFNVMDGADGSDGDVGPAGPKGDPGNDGVGIVWVNTVSVSSEDGGVSTYEILLTDGSTYRFSVKNGSKGSTPVKGEDYYTEADKQEMVAAVMAALPVWEGGSY